MDVHRLSIKFYVADPASVELSDFVPIFHRWIQQNAVEGILVDVADYKHVFNGPGIVLVGHECDYSLEMGEGRPGFLYTRKRHMAGGLADRVAHALHFAVKACLVLEGDPILRGRIRFRTDEIRLALLDRLRAPNTPETFQQVEAELSGCWSDWLGGTTLQVEHASQDPRQCLTIRFKAERAAELAELRRRIETSAALVK